MERRRFILATASAGLLAGAGSFGFASYFSAEPPLGNARLAAQLAELADRKFEKLAAQRNLKQTAGSLSEKGVISTESGINYRRLGDLAKTEPLVEYEGFYYTETELDLYALAAHGAAKPSGSKPA